MVSASLGGGCPATLAGAATPGGSGFAAGGALGAWCATLKHWQEGYTLPFGCFQKLDAGYPESNEDS